MTPKCFHNYLDHHDGSSLSVHQVKQTKYQVSSMVVHDIKSDIAANINNLT